MSLRRSGRGQKKSTSSSQTLPRQFFPAIVDQILKEGCVSDSGDDRAKRRKLFESSMTSSQFSYHWGLYKKSKSGQSAMAAAAIALPLNESKDSETAPSERTPPRRDAPAAGPLSPGRAFMEKQPDLGAMAKYSFSYSYSVLTEVAVNNSGRKNPRRTKSVIAAEKMIYRVAYKWATENMAKYKWSPRTAAKKARQVYGKHAPSKSTLRRFLQSGREPGTSPIKPGQQRMIPVAVEEKLAEMIMFWANIGYITNRTFVIQQMINTIKQTELLYYFCHNGDARRPISERCNSWYYRFIGKNETVSATSALPQEIIRQRWSTAENIKMHYDVLQKYFLEAKVAAWVNADGDECAEQDEGATFTITDASRILSMDETKLSLDMTECNTKTLHKKGEKNNIPATKSGKCATGVACNGADGTRYPPFFIWARAKQEGAITDLKGAPTSSIWDSTKKRYLPSLHQANTKGSMTWEFFIEWMESVIVNVVRPTKEKPIVLLCDGHGSHLRYECVEYAAENNIMILLRPPHTSHIVQGEDVHGFGLLKREFNEAKERKQNSLFARALRIQKDGGIVHQKDRELQWYHLMPLICTPWEKAFSKANILTAWAKIGVSPFTRCVENKLKESEEKKGIRAQAAAAMLIRLEDADEPEVDADEPNVDDLQTRPNRRSSADWWTTCISAPEAFQKQKEQHEIRTAEEEKANEARETRTREQLERVNEMIVQGSTILRSDRRLESLRIHELKQCLAAKGIYPGQKPAKKYRGLSKRDLLGQLNDVLAASSSSPPPPAPSTDGTTSQQ